MFASSYPLADVFISTLYLVVFILWLLLAFHVFADIFRSHDLSGTAKALWVLLIVVFPLLGCLLYLVIRGSDMHTRQIHAMQAQQRAFEEYIRHVANTKE